MVEQAPSIMALVREPCHRIVLANAAFRRLFGADIVNRVAQEVLPPQIAGAAIEKLHQVYRSATPMAFSAVEIPVLRHDQRGTELRVLDCGSAPKLGPSRF
ncbi:PAS domain-containing protein [Sphingomonas faeni]|uniref:PAS domain-containing protein n=1 Tax=Sphingomonas faeni TaxID=185950 RepID=UPI00359386CC